MASLQLKLISGGNLEQGYTFDFSSSGGSIGRSKDCDWTLDDADRYISNKHILISLIDHTFVLTDVSSNGVFINNSQVPLGKGNTCALALGDHITLGKFRIEVAGIELQSAALANVMPGAIPPAPHNLRHASATQSSHGDLLDLINCPKDSQPIVNADSQSPDSLGLFAILSGHVQPPAVQTFDYKSTVKPTESASASNSQSFTDNVAQARSGNNSQSSQTPQQANTSNNSTSPSTIPDDWNFDDSQVAAPSHVAPPERAVAQSAPLIDQIPNPSLAEQPPVNAQQSSSFPPAKPTTKETFFELLYQKLGLPKAQIDTVDQTQFANDLVQILTTSTQGIMALLAGRSVFKQESRLSMTMIKPQSNNPIKFSLDPSDTLEMLLVKKKPGYMSAQDAYAEALHDVQLHQMAFLSGLQATLNGLLDELSPRVIEQELNKSQQGFLGLKVNSQKWQIFADKQAALHKQVAENLNDILSRHFSSAYEKHIDAASNNK